MWIFVYSVLDTPMFHIADSSNDLLNHVVVTLLEAANFLDILLLRVVLLQCRVELPRALGPEGGDEDEHTDTGEHDPTDVEEVRSPVGLGKAVQPPTNDGVDDGVNDDVGNIQEGHDGTEGRNPWVGVVEAGNMGLDKGGEGDITRSPAHGDGDEDGGNNPSSLKRVETKGSGGDFVEDPGNRKGEGVETEPREGSLHSVGEDEDKQGTEQLTKVGTTNQKGRVGGFLEDELGVVGTKTVFQVPVEDERDRVAEDQPGEAAFSEDDTGTLVNGNTESSESGTDLTNNARAFFNGFNGAGSGVIVSGNLDARPQEGSEDVEEGGHDGGKGFAELKSDEGGEKGTGGTSDFVEDVDKRVHLLQLNNIATHNVTGNNAANQFDHAVGNTGDDEDGDDTARVPAA